MRLSAPLLLACLVPSAAIAQDTPPDLADMVGARAGQAENELGRRGYQFVRADQGDDRSYTYWWNKDRRQCVTIATMEGRYNSITATLAPDCRQSPSARSSPGYAPPARRPAPGYDVDPAFSQSPTIIDGRIIQLALVCFGDGSKAGVSSASEWRWNDRRERYEQGYRSQLTTEVLDASLMLQLWERGGRIRLPRSLIPPINSRGDNGWWDLRDVSAGPASIKATYRLNGLNRPRVTVDRRTGRIIVQGAASYGFRGSCDEIGRERRRF
jgi:hypothetical protein